MQLQPAVGTFPEYETLTERSTVLQMFSSLTKTLLEGTAVLEQMMM